MKRVGIDQITGTERLAKDICLGNGTVLLPVGSILKRDYIKYLDNLNITAVYIEDKANIKMEIAAEEVIQEQCKSIVKSTIEKYTHCGNAELSDIVKAAESIIEDILKQPEVLYNLYCVREKSESTYCHGINVAALSVLLALKMKLGIDRVKDIAIGALLEDLGILYLPFDCSNLVFDSCDEIKKREIRKHVITGYSALEKEKWLSNISKEIILSHHERDDGSGYPMKLTKDKIRLEVKIVALCEEFDSRVYGFLCNKLKVHEAIEYIMSMADSKFDHKVVQKFLESVAAYPIGTYVVTNTAKIGVVIRQNAKMPTRPVLQIIEIEGKKYKVVGEIDLLNQLTVFIRDTISEKILPWNQ